jgi:hypothetical protein
MHAPAGKPSLDPPVTGSLHANSGERRLYPGLVRIDAPGRSRAADPRLRGALLMPLCVLAVHQLRFYLAFGDGAPTRLAREGHGYISAFEPVALLAAAIALGGVVGRLARAWQQSGPDGSARRLDQKRTLVRAWLLCAGALLAVYCAQELVEGAFAAGHPAGLAGIFGSGGWIAIPVAALIGGALAAALKLADTLVALVARRRAVRRPAEPAKKPSRIPGAADWRLDPAAGVAAGRAPPPSFSFS